MAVSLTMLCWVLNDFMLSVAFLYCYAENAVILLNLMGQHALKNVNNCSNTTIYSYLEISGGQISNPFWNAVHFLTPVLIRHLGQLKTVVFLHWCLLCAVILIKIVSYLILAQRLVYIGEVLVQKLPAKVTCDRQLHLAWPHCARQHIGDHLFLLCHPRKPRQVSVM